MFGGKMYGIFLFTSSDHRKAINAKVSFDQKKIKHACLCMTVTSNLICNAPKFSELVSNHFHSFQ